MAGADLRAALVASCFLGALPPVDFLAVCLVRAIVLSSAVEKLCLLCEDEEMMEERLGTEMKTQIIFSLCTFKILVDVFLFLIN